MDTKRELLWTDERIIQALEDGGFDHENWLIGKLTLQVVRDEYEARLAALQQAAPQMERVPDGEYQLDKHKDTILIGKDYKGNTLIQVGELIGSHVRYAVVSLPAGWQLTRPATAAGEEVAP